MLKEQLLKRFEEVKPRPGEAAALVARMKNGTFSEADRQRLLEMLDAEQEMLEMLSTCPSSPGKRVRHGQAKRRRQVAKVSRRRNRR
jgi:hypothetical protein